jgi:spore coat polysaccharide biosynthesis predicted glycosyltransferase SpsG
MQKKQAVRPPRLLIIGKGGKKEGMGHLVRISTLVDEFAPHYDTTISVRQDSYGESFFKDKGIAYIPYRDNRGLYRFLEKTGKYRVIIIDIYRISIDVIKKIETYCDFLINFDDMQRRVQQQIKGTFICPQEPYNCAVSLDGHLIHTARGADYFPLRKEFSRYREKKRLQKEVKDIGICLGGVPEPEETLELIRLLDRFLDKKINLHVVMGFKPGEIPATAFSSRVTFVRNIDNMAAFIEKMDVGIIAGGFVKFEFMCIGTPFLLVSRARHQHQLAKKFSEKGFGVYMGPLKEVLDYPQTFEQKMNAFLEDNELREKMFEDSRRLVDGKGSSRILDMVNSAIGSIVSG